MPIFPTQVIIEILTYLRPKSLTQLQLVCKEWRAIIHDQYFIEKHKDRAPVVCYWFNFVQTTGSLNNNSSDTDSVRVSYLHGLDGLVLLRITNTQKIFIWNPATRGVLGLPDPHHDGNYGFTFSYVPATKDYRIVSVYKDKKYGRIYVEVFTPGHSETWRRLTFPENVNINWHEEGKRVSVISSGGAVHCLLTSEVGNVTFEEIVSLDIETECFVVNYVPKGLFGDWTKVCALDWDGKLGFACVNGENLEVMELEDYRKQRWHGKKRVIHLPFMKINNNNEEDKISNLLPLFAKAGGIWFWLEGEKLCSYKMETREITDLTQSQGFSVRSKLYPYKPSLVNIEGMQPEDPKLQKCRPGWLNQSLF
ncbi:hypothetical protein BUALT_Bualt03G0071300 [Buddleja alternifolia]|uniref:F-box domain-containing protein n=1 Tax=Buddleja alternifolia TaxID=168488 RepID=A0AAV6Y2K7_9LAMI|nr:hypothetical protein BUALT_Bualt03G0071300 [Buddleja alternifolia]